MSEDELEAVTREMERVGKRAIAFQRYVLRRAWGVYYAIWAFAFFWFVFLPYLILSFVSQNADIAFYLGYTLVGGLAGYATWVNFSKAYRTLILKRSLFGERRSYYRWFFVAFWISFFIAIPLLFHFFGSRVLSVYYLLLLSVPLVNLFTLKRFFEKIPFEGLLSNASLLISDSLSVYYSMLSSYSFLAISWCIITFIWVFSSLYALYEAPEELVQLE